MTAKPRRTAVGRVEYLDFDGNRGSRFFIVAAGIGADAHLFYKLNPLVKGHLGMAAYYAMATRLWLTHPMEKFAVEIEREQKLKSPRCWPFASATSAECCASLRRVRP